MISESQERMIAIVRPAMLEAVEAVLDRWELEHAAVGEVTDTGELRALWKDGVVGEIPARLLTDECPRYEVTQARRAPIPEREVVGAPSISEALVELLASPALRSREFVYRRYDQLVGSRTVRRPGLDAAVLRLRPSMRGLAVSLDGQGRIARLDPFTGGALAVLEAARNVACTGAAPKALVNCLNFGNPEHPEVMWQFSEVVDGMSEACRALGVPVIGGNVSFYNESRGADIDPTPVVGVIGLIDVLTDVPPGPRLAAGDAIVLLGETRPELGGSAWATAHGLRDGSPPVADLDAAVALHALVAALVNERIPSGAHDGSDGGLAVALSEMAITGGVGFDVDLGDALACFSEAASRVVLAVTPDRVDTVIGRARAAGVPATTLGTAGGDRLMARRAFDVDLEAATRAYRDAIPALMGAVRV
jgi:phosphoribosylformylglycinamidine synthase